MSDIRVFSFEEEGLETALQEMLWHPPGILWSHVKQLGQWSPVGPPDGLRT